MRSSPSMSTATPLTRNSAAVAARRSDSLTRSSFRPRITRGAFGKGRGHRQHRIFVDHGRRARGRHFDAAQARRRARADRRPPRRLRCARRAARSTAPISHERREQAGAQRIHHHAVEDHVRARHQQRRDQRKRRRGRIGGNRDRPRHEFRLAGERDAAAAVPLSARPALRRRNGRASSRCGRASPPLRSRRSRPARQGRPAASPISIAPTEPAARTRSASDRARRQASAAGGRRPTASVRAPIRSSGSSTRRIGRLRSEASPSNVAVIGQPATAPSASRQPVPELPKSSAAAGSAKPPTPDAVDRPCPLAGPLDAGAERPQGLGGIEHVLAFEQAARSWSRRPSARRG